jgi:hypothetical protein
LAEPLISRISAFEVSEKEKAIRKVKVRNFIDFTIQSSFFKLQS